MPTTQTATLALGFAPVRQRKQSNLGRPSFAQTLATAFRDQLMRTFRPQMRAGVRFIVGAYDVGARTPTVFVEYDRANPSASRIAWEVAQKAPEDWDDSARAQLRRAGLVLQ